MMRKVSTWLVVAFAGGGLVAGCGNSSTAASSSTSSSSAATSSSGAATSSSGAATGSRGATSATGAQPGPGGTTAPNGAQTALQNVANCKQSIQALKTISSSAKAKLEAVCEKAASGDPTALHKVAQEACVELVNAAHVPAGAYRERALAYCNVK
jgi:hypothetical protein